MSPRTPLALGRPWVKICGLTRPEDADAAAELGAGLIGLNFWNGSPRRVAPGAAREIVAAVAGRALLVGVFVDEDPARIDETLAAHGLDLVQLHGDEPDAVVDRFGTRAIRALRSDRHLPPPEAVKGEGGAGAQAEVDPRGPGSSVRTAGPWLGVSTEGQGGAGAASPSLDSLALNRSVFAFLVDAPAGRRYGGTGTAWDWSAARAVVAASRAPVLVAGGIRAENVVSALSASGAAGVDVASGVERAPGVKDRARMERLFEEVRRAPTAG
jgi:phosphoribosylanthranilate isomerase